MTATHPKRIARFGVFDFDFASERLRRSGVQVRLAKQPASLLGLLLADPGKLVSREAIRAGLWPDGTWVDFEQSINQCIRQIRRALRDDAIAARFVETVPRLGYRFVGAVEFVEQGQPGESAGRRAALGARVAIALSVALVAALGLGIAKLTRDARGVAQPAEAFGHARFDKLTNHGGVWTAAISSDGARVAYAVQDSRGFAVRVRPIDGTGETTLVEPVPTPIRALQFSPAGDELYFARQEAPVEGYSALYRVKALGGEPQRLVFDVDSGIAFAPRGAARMAFIRGNPVQGSTALVTAGADGAGETVVAEWGGPSRLLFVAPAWSPGGERIAVATSHAEPQPHVQIATVEVGGGSPIDLGAYPWREVSGLAWLPDGSGLLIAAREADSDARPQLWHVGYPAGTVRPISRDLSSYWGVSLAASGHRFVTLRQERLDPLLTFVSSAGQELRRAVDFAPRDAPLAVRRGPAGSAIVVTWDAQRMQAWRVSGAEDRPAPLLAEVGRDARGLSISPDAGTAVYAAAGSDGIRHLWSVPTRGGQTRQVTEGDGELAPTACSDGVVLFRRQHGPGLWIQAGPGREPRRVSDLEPGGPAICSPDGTRVAFITDAEHGNGVGPQRSLVVLRVNDGGVLHFSPWSEGLHLAWAPQGDALTYAGRPEAPSVIWRLPFGAGAPPPEPLLDAPGGGIISFDWSADGRTLLALHGSMQSDVMLVEELR